MSELSRSYHSVIVAAAAITAIAAGAIAASPAAADAAAKEGKESGHALPIKLAGTLTNHHGSTIDIHENQHNEIVVEFDEI
ncbi:hypothetical protein [Streptomyces sp. NPDC099088]|uniref:hypothetical protein n=1 Tax=Streptomyces sp. NPDC099088 TaxID=3366101 RepID=UPI0037F68F2D